MKNSPYPVEVKAGDTYFWCKCGLSKKQPFCDGSHKNTRIAPIRYLASKTAKVFFCGCKKSKNEPFCDGTHNQLAKNQQNKKVDRLFSLMVQPDSKKIDISNNESILTASLRNNVSHLSACGGTGKCSTCRIEVLDGLKHCSSKTAQEIKVSEKLKFPSHIRLACQTRVTGNITYRRLLLDKRDLNLNNNVSNQKLESVGTIRSLTIMFCDIKGFTPFSESLSAYDIIFILNRYFSIMREVILQNGGEINNYIGDAIMAIFGLQESRQQTLRAIASGLEMIKSMDKFKIYLKKAYGRDFDIRIGIHYGEVIVGSVGHGEDKKLTVIGDAVNVASRIEAINKDAGTRLLVSDQAYQNVTKSVEVKNFLRLKLRGVSSLMTLHEISRVKDEKILFQETTREKTFRGKVWVRTLPILELEQGEKKKFEYEKKESECKPLKIVPVFLDDSYIWLEKNRI